jgi:hypothetical protein
MNVSKSVRELLLGVLGGTGCISILLGIQALSNKGNWIIFMVGGVLLLAGSLFVASKFKDKTDPKK